MKNILTQLEELLDQSSEPIIGVQMNAAKSDFEQFRRCLLSTIKLFGSNKIHVHLPNCPHTQSSAKWENNGSLFFVSKDPKHFIERYKQYFHNRKQTKEYPSCDLIFKDVPIVTLQWHNSITTILQPRSINNDNTSKE